MAITAPFLISGQIERSPREDTFTSQDIGPPFGLRETDHYLPGCAPQVTAARRIWEMDAEIAPQRDEEYNRGTGWRFLHNDYLYANENPSSADFGIRHSVLRSVRDGTWSDPVPTSGAEFRVHRETPTGSASIRELHASRHIPHRRQPVLRKAYQRQSTAKTATKHVRTRQRFKWNRHPATCRIDPDSWFWCGQ